MIAMAVPIMNNKGQPHGVLVGCINLEAPNFLDVITQTGYGKTGGYFIVSRTHRLIITASDKSRTMKPLPPPGTSPMIDRLMDGYEGTAILVRDNGQEVLNSGKRIAASDWNLVASLPTSEAFAPLLAMQQRVALIALFYTVFTSGLIWWVLRRLLTPALDTIKTLADLVNTDRIPQSLPVVRQDEIGKLIAGFNGLLKTLQLQAMALRVSDQALRDISQAVVITDASQKIISTNEAYATITGYSQLEVMGLNCRFLQGPQTDPLALEAIRLALENKVTFSGELLNYRKDGTAFWNDLTISPIRDDDGTVSHYIGVTRDVTARKTSESNVRQLAFYDTGACSMTGWPRPLRPANALRFMER
jgi:PAS domain S-box-containing protein